MELESDTNSKLQNGTKYLRSGAETTKWRRNCKRCKDNKVTHNRDSKYFYHSLKFYSTGICNESKAEFN